PSPPAAGPDRSPTRHERAWVLSGRPSVTGCPYGAGGGPAWVGRAERTALERIDGELVVSATDLVGHLACAHLTLLDGLAALGQLQRPDREDREVEVLTRRGLAHEAAYLGALRAEGLTVVEIAAPDPSLPRLEALRQREADTLAAMAAGADVVFQATFLDETGPVRWRGHADFLRKVDRPSGRWAWSYEPEDTKLARQVKPSAVLQLCHYAEQVARLQ